VRQAAAAGFAVDDGCVFSGVCTSAVALQNPYSGFCISASVFSGSMSRANLDRLVQDLTKFLLD
jgi:hypothetical protein